MWYIIKDRTILSSKQIDLDVPNSMNVVVQYEAFSFNLHIFVNKQVAVEILTPSTADIVDLYKKELSSRRIDINLPNTMNIIVQYEAFSEYFQPLYSHSIDWRAILKKSDIVYVLVKKGLWMKSIITDIENDDILVMLLSEEQVLKLEGKKDINGIKDNKSMEDSNLQYDIKMNEESYLVQGKDGEGKYIYTREHIDNSKSVENNEDISGNSIENNGNKSDKVIIEPAPMFKKVGRYSEEISNRYFT
jgi:hypothetical protein